jgi:hypothetical protein
MKPMRARCATKWQLRLAAGFALLRERHSDIDTIPKPGGLDLVGPRSGLSVRSLSGFCPELVRPLSGTRKCNFGGMWKTTFSTF